MSKSKTKTDKSVCSAEQAISAANWDKHSTWEALSNKTNIRPWQEGKLGKPSTAAAKKSKK